MEDRRTALAALGLLGVGLATAQAATAASGGPQPHVQGSRRQRSVIDFGARGDGQSDDTEAFNAASEAALEWGDERMANIRVPAGTYRVDGTIRLRKGQHLAGDGEATLIDASHARGPTMTLGLDARGRADPGGAPVGASGLRFLGGTGQDPVILVAAPGFSLSRLFISAAGTGIAVRGSDGTISDVVIDQALRGLVFTGAQNIVVHGLITYLANFAVTLEEGATDIIVSDALFGYSRYASVLFSEGARSISAVRFANCEFLSNESYDTFLGHVHVRSAPSDAQFNNCTFRNWPGYAVRQEAGSGAELYFDGCLFDGSPSRSGYGSSPSAGGLLTGAGARFSVSNCHFRNLRAPIVRVGPQLDRLSLSGGSVRDCTGHPLTLAGAGTGELAIRGVEGFGLQSNGSIVLPWRGTTTVWRLTGRTTEGDGAYVTLDCVVAANGNGHVLALKPIAQYGAMQPVAGFGEQPGGPQQIAGVDSGFVTISASGRAVGWIAESMS